MPRWLRNAHLHTIHAALLGRMLPRPAWRRERWDTPDGDFIDVDHLDAEGPAVDQPGTREASVALPPPLVVLFHGLEGSSASHYARAFAPAVAARGWALAIPHFRGCSGEPNRLPRAYHSGDSAEIAWILQRFAREQPHRPLFAAGVSLGGNALLKHLGEAGRGAPARAAAAVCAPLHLQICGDALGRGFNRLYTRMFLATMKALAEAKLARHPGVFDAAAMRRARTLREFDNVVTAPLHGFRDTDDYWARASALPLLGGIACPTLLLNALDDPFVPRAALPDPARLPAPVQAEFPVAGGHVGFVSGPFPGRLDWLPRRVLDHFAAALCAGVDQGVDHMDPAGPDPAP